MLTVAKDEAKNGFFVMGTSNGGIKRTEISKYDNIRKTGIIAIGLKPQDELKWVKISNGNNVIVEVSKLGQCICYHEQEARPMGRSASGVMGMRLRRGDFVMSMDIVSMEDAKFDAAGSQRGSDILVVLENGFGKRTMLRNFNIQHRGGMGIKAANCTAKTGPVVGMHITNSDDGDVVLATNKGQFIRMALKTIKRLGRDTQGVTLIRLKDGDKVASSTIIREEAESNQLISQEESNTDLKKIENDDGQVDPIVVNNYKNK